MHFFDYDPKDKNHCWEDNAKTREKRPVLRVQHLLQPQSLASTSPAGFLGEIFSKVGLAERRLMDKLKKIHLAKVSVVEKSETELPQREENIGQTEEKKGKDEPFTGTPRKKMSENMKKKVTKGKTLHSNRGSSADLSSRSPHISKTVS